MSLSILQWQRNPPPVTRRHITRYQQLERTQAFAPVRLRLARAAQHFDDILVIARMTEAVHRSGLVARGLDELVVGMGGRELPMLNLIDGYTTHLGRALLADDGDRAL